MSSPTNRYDAAAEAERELGTLQKRSTVATIARAISYLAYAWALLSLVILAFGFFLLLFGANPEAGFSMWVYRHLDRTMEPFRGIFPEASTSIGSTLDVSILFAMLVYGLVGLGVHSLIDWLTYRREHLDNRIRRDRLLLRRAYDEERQRQQASSHPQEPAPSPQHSAYAQQQGVHRSPQQEPGQGPTRGG